MKTHEAILAEIADAARGAGTLATVDGAVDFFPHNLEESAWRLDIDPASQHWRARFYTWGINNDTDFETPTATLDLHFPATEQVGRKIWNTFSRATNN